MMRALAAALTIASLALPLQARAWWNKDWTERATITLNTNTTGVKVSQPVNAVLVPLRLHSGNFDFTAAKEDGSDLRVVAGDDKTPLKFTVERFDGINELGLLWVVLPTVAADSDKNKVYVYAGNAKAPAEAAANVFDSGLLLAAHFSEKDGPAADAVSGSRSVAPIEREPNGLLASSARLSGTPVVWAGNDKLALPAGGAATVSMWLEAADTSKGTLLQWGPLKLSLDGGKLVAELGGKPFAGGSVAPGVWTHVALTVGAGKAQLFVNGDSVAQADATLPALSGAAALGAGYNGLVDEFQVSPSVRTADWLKLATASQGTEGKLISAVRESADAADSGGSPSYFGILVKNLTTDAWVVIAILLAMFAIAVAVMVRKAMLIGRTDRDNRSFLQRFRTASDNLLTLEHGVQHAHSSLFRLYRAGVRELAKRDVGQKDVSLSGASIDAVKAAVDADMVRETHHLNAQMVLLTIAISGGPFLGLLGTVVGVMITFAAIAAAGDVNVNAIAPGIAAALLATVAGLGVAIPSLFGYNYLASRIKNISADMQIFVDEFVTRVAETYGQR